MLYPHPSLAHRLFAQNRALNRKGFGNPQSLLLHPIDDEIFLYRFPGLEKLWTHAQTPYSISTTRSNSPPHPADLRKDSAPTLASLRKAPYLDIDVVETLASCPEDTLPFSYTVFSEQPAAPSPPLPSWATEEAASKLSEKLQSSALVEAGSISEPWLRHQLKKFNRHPKPLFQELWGPLVLDIWFGQYIAGNRQCL